MASMSSNGKRSFDLSAVFSEFARDSRRVWVVAFSPSSAGGGGGSTGQTWMFGRKVTLVGRGMLFKMRRAARGPDSWVWTRLLAIAVTT